ncbi:MAG TPA: DMT family transporter [Burkholderiales bacterium]|nr:DMT family transporter [Burkholderiales bacterium]
MRTPQPHPQQRSRALALAALFAGAAAIATAPLFVKVSEAGPVATAFWRAALALPVLWVWSLAHDRHGHYASFSAERGRLAAAGLLFAGDLAVWHWAIVLTSVANSTLLANLAPIFVTLAVWLLYRRPPRHAFLAGLALALAGVALLVGADLRLGTAAVAGDTLGVITALFYAAYQLTVTRLRARVATSSLMAWSALFTAAALAPLALASGERILPQTAAGWAKLAALALIAQAAGQSLIAYAMAHLPATASSVGLLAQPVLAALFAWALLGEALGPLEIAGGALVLAGIWLAQRAELGK